MTRVNIFQVRGNPPSRARGKSFQGEKSQSSYSCFKHQQCVCDTVYFATDMLCLSVAHSTKQKVAYYRGFDSNKD